MAITLPRNKEMFEDFQLDYNNLASNLAPGLTKYEISVYLTKAYHTFVLSLASTYEKNEAARKALIELVDTASISPQASDATTDACKIVPEALIFALPDNVLQVVFESVKMANNAKSCLSGKQVAVLPVKHDQFYNIYEDPFRYTDTRALRLDVEAPILTTSNTYTNKRCAEIISKDTNVESYFIRFIRKPGPIILETLTNDSIAGITSETTCELNPIYDKDIVRLAAELAYQDYKAA